MYFKTFGQLVSFCRTILGSRPTDERSTAMIKALLAMAHMKICVRQAFDFLEQTETFALAAGASDMVAPDGATVLNADGAIAPYCRNVVHIQLGSTGSFLTYQEHILNLIVNGSIAVQPAQTPIFWGTFGRRIIVAPATAVADTIEVFYIGGATTLVSDAQEPLLPLEFRPIIAYEAIADVCSSDMFDVRIQARARDNAEDMMGSLFLCGGLAQPAYRSQAQITGELR